MASKFQIISFAEKDTQIKEYKRRKPHHKTRAGCLSCKGKRVKCDQKRPTCSRCVRNGRACSYTPEATRDRLLQNQQVWALISSRSLSPAAQDDPLGASHGTSRPFLLRHFGYAWREIFNLPRLPVDIHSLVEATPFLQRTLLAISASHLRHRTNRPAQHRLAEHFQQSLALSEFRRELARPLSELPPAGIDSLVLTAMLLNMLIFVLPHDEDEEPANVNVADPARSWVFSSSADRLGWLALVTGLKPLLLATRPYRANTLLGPVLDKSEEWERLLAGQDERLDAVPETWLTAFGVPRDSQNLEDEKDTAEFYASLPPQAKRVYLFREPLRLLASCATLEPTRVNIFRYVEVIGKLRPQFRQLLYDRDERALWILGYWMGLMCRFTGLWWCDRRVRRDQLAIALWFEYLKPADRPGAEGRLWGRLMDDFHAAPEWPPTKDSTAPQPTPTGRTGKEYYLIKSESGEICTPYQVHLLSCMNRQTECAARAGIIDFIPPSPKE